jgi:acetamidase/formamidase
MPFPAEQMVMASLQEYVLSAVQKILKFMSDVSAIVELQVSVLKDLDLNGPILLPRIEDVPFLARPLTADELDIATKQAAKWEQQGIEKSAPISVIGTGTNLNTAVDNALERTAALFDMTVPEVKNRVTITGAIEIGRAPGVVTASLRVPVIKLQEKGLWELVRDQYHMYR